MSPSVDYLQYDDLAPEQQEVIRDMAFVAGWGIEDVMRWLRGFRSPAETAVKALAELSEAMAEAIQSVSDDVDDAFK